jgi:hypothetical protein
MSRLGFIPSVSRLKHYRCINLVRRDHFHSNSKRGIGLSDMTGFMHENLENSSYHAISVDYITHSSRLRLIETSANKFRELFHVHYTFSHSEISSSELGANVDIIATMNYGKLVVFQRRKLNSEFWK